MEVDNFSRKTHCVDTVVDREVSSALKLYELIRTGNLGEFCFCLLLENSQTQVGGFRLWFTKAAGGNDSPDTVSQFALEVPHSWQLWIFSRENTRKQQLLCSLRSNPAFSFALLKKRSL